MPLYEYYCEPCHGVFDAFRQMRDAAEPAPCPECSREAPRMMSTFSAFVVRDGYPRRIPDKGTYWHMGKEVKQRAKRMKGYEHPELAKPKAPNIPGKGDVAALIDRKLGEHRDKVYRSKWATDQYGMKTAKEAKKKVARKTLGAG